MIHALPQLFFCSTLLFWDWSMLICVILICLLHIINSNVHNFPHILTSLKLWSILKSMMYYPYSWCFCVCVAHKYDCDISHTCTMYIVWKSHTLSFPFLIIRLFQNFIICSTTVNIILSVLLYLCVRVSLGSIYTQEKNC